MSHQCCPNRGCGECSYCFGDCDECNFGFKKCQKCESFRILDFYGRVRDAFSAQILTKDYGGYVPYDIGLGGDEDLKGSLCLDCGQLQGTWPLPSAEIEM